jgi:hypothetical protein
VVVILGACAADVEALAGRFLDDRRPEAAVELQSRPEPPRELPRETGRVPLEHEVDVDDPSRTMQEKVTNRSADEIQGDSPLSREDAGLRDLPRELRRQLPARS